MKEQLFAWIVTAGGSAITVAITWVLMKLAAYLSHRVGSAILARAATEITGAVLEVEQTFVSVLKADAADGKLTSAEMKEAKDKAIAVAKRNLGKEGLERLGRVIGVDLEQWLGSKVESAVGALRVSAPASPAAGAGPLGKAA